MASILAAAASGLSHSQAVIDTVANNLANVNTPAFKRGRAMAEGTPNTSTSQGLGQMSVADTTYEAIFDVGAPQRTEDPLQFAITDDTFFRVIAVDGSVQYTRLGSLQADNNGNISAYGGLPLEPVIQGPGLRNFAIDGDGVVTGANTNNDRIPVGRVTLVRFLNPAGLEATGRGLYRETVNSGATAEGFPNSTGFAPIIAGALEGSNVEVAEEFANLIIAQRAYQATAKTFSIGDDMLKLATNITQ